MWKRILSGARQAQPRDDPQRRRLAIAVLLLETARADFEHAPAELEVIRQELGAALDLDGAALDALLGSARTRAHQAVSLHEFVATLNEELSAQDKQALFEMLWKVAYADGRVDPHEEHLLRRLADLLHVPHRTFIQQKLKVARR